MQTILIVDDSATDRRLAGGLLQKHGNWNIVYAADGKEALTEIELHLPEMVITDLQMPEMNGLELVQTVKAKYPLIPVVLMTAKGSEEIAVQALQQGAAFYVPKSKLGVDLPEIVDRVLAASGEKKTQSRLMNRLKATEHTFELENDLSLITSLVAFFRDSVRGMRLCDDTEHLRIGIALEEALLNAYYHGNLEVSSELRENNHEAYYELARERTKLSPYRDRRIHVTVKMTRDEAVYHIRDEGAGFDPSRIPDPTDPANLERPCGRGLLLMQTFMDDVRYNEMGNAVTLTVRRSRKLDNELDD
jgi:CheY-like chemotaxis protein